MLAVFMIIGAVLLRLLPHLPNFAPITALGLFGGVYLKKRDALIIPMAGLIISDYLLLYVNPFQMKADFSHIYPITALFHSTTLFVWGSFLISCAIGLWLRSHKKPEFLLFGTFVASLQFFLITNFAVWMMGTYSRGIEGLWQSYMMGLPFFQWTVLGDLFYTGVFFLSFEAALMIEKHFRSELAVS